MPTLTRQCVLPFSFSTTARSRLNTKQALKKYSAEQIAEVGATLTVEDVFGYDVNAERLKG